MLRYDTTASFTTSGSYSYYVVSSTSVCVGMIFDGRYIYTVPLGNGIVTQYDTTASFTSSGSYATFDMTTVNANSKAFLSGAFDGRYVYFCPYSYDRFTRYDTTLPFTSASSYTVFTTTTLNSKCRSFIGLVFDGRYMFCVPNAYGVVTMYDTTQSFTSASSYSYFDTATVNTSSNHFVGGVYDGKYVYFVPQSSSGIITRILASQSLNTTLFRQKPHLSLQYSVYDVAVSQPAVGDLLQWNGTKWVNVATQSITITDNSSVVRTIKVIVTA